MINISYYRDDHGYPKVESTFEELGGFLEEDIQSVPSVCTEIINKVHEIESGKQETWKNVGNAWRLILNSETKTARIEGLFSTPSEGIELPLEDFRKALEGWLEFIEKK